MLLEVLLPRLNPKQRKSVSARSTRETHFWLMVVVYAIGTAEDIDKLARRQVKPTRQHNEECRKLLGLMGIPFLIVSVLSQYQSIVRQWGVS